MHEIHIVSDLDGLVQDQLPHEFEITLGRIMTNARLTIVRLPLPDHRFFSYWETPEDLATAAAEAAGVDLQVDIMEDAPNWGGEAKTKLMVVRCGWVRAQRVLGMGDLLEEWVNR